MATLSAHQKLLQEQLPKARALFERHGLDAAAIDALAPLIERFAICVPLIGAFSSGKSSLINALVGERLLAVDVTPETAMPAELRYGSERSVVGLTADGRRIPLSAKELEENRLDALQPDGWVQVELPHRALAARPQLALVDLPGWDSGIAAHERVIDRYAARSLAYAVVVSVEEGSLRDSLRRALQELAVAQMPVLLVLTKADKRSAEEVATVLKRLQADLTSLMGRAPLASAVTSARKKTLAPFEAALDALQAQADTLFLSRVVAPWRRLLQHAAEHLRLRAQQEYPEAERLQAEIDRLQEELSAFDRRLQQETEALAAQIDPILNAIRRKVESTLSQRLESLAARALHGEAIGDEMVATARLIVAETLREEFDSALQRYLSRLADALPSRHEFRFEPADSAARDGDGEFGWKALAVTLGPLLLQIPHPLGKLLAPVVIILGSLLDGPGKAAQREVELARQREEARDWVRQAISQLLTVLQRSLREALVERIALAQREVAQSIDRERAEINRTLAEMKAALEQGKAETAALQQRAKADLEQIEALLAQLPSAPTEAEQ